MISTINIKGYRGLREFSLNKLGRVNLLVGANNCGKTSILEAIQILASAGDPLSLADGVIRRGERISDSIRRRNGISADHDLSHLFYGHEVAPGQEFTIATDENCALGGVTVRVQEINGLEHSRQSSLPFESGSDDALDAPAWTLTVDWTHHDFPTFELPINSFGGVSFDSLRRFPRRRFETAIPVRHISTSGLSIETVVQMFEDLVLKPEEGLAVDALRTIEPTIERVATVGANRRSSYPGERGGFVVKLTNFDQRVPIGSMGDGMWRMLGLALALVNAEGGILLVDEIDTGLHYTVMDQMWKLLSEGARKLSVQVFATTHSRDCYESLATIARAEVSDGSEVTIQRIETGRNSAIGFSEQEIVAAAERGMEVR